MTTNEKNRMIAEFMGANYSLNGEYFIFPVGYHIKQGNKVDFTELQYHTSWAWLMPVAKKVQDELSELLTQFRHSKNGAGINEACRHRERILWLSNHFDIAITHDCIVEAIQYLTTQQKEAGDE